MTIDQITEQILIFAQSGFSGDLDKVKDYIKLFARQCCDEDRKNIKEMYPDLKHSWLSKMDYPKEIQSEK